MQKQNLLELEKDGFTVLSFSKLASIFEMQAIVRDILNCEPTELHRQKSSQDDHIELIETVTNKIASSDLVSKLVKANVDHFIRILGPDIDIQAVPHVRISRPDNESDLIDWHRDTFYGNMPWEMNLWFPLFPLHSGAGLRILTESHLKPSTNIREIKDIDPFRSAVTKGSPANKIGYLYSPKIDDTISNMKLDQIKLLSPRVGEAILFFGCMVHKAENASNYTRISIDLRIRNAHTKTNTKADYYKPLSRGVIDKCTSQFLSRI